MEEAMTRRRTLIGIAIALLVVLASLSTPARGGSTGHPGTTSGNAVIAWNQIAVTTLVGLPGPAGGAPPSSAIHVAMVQGAVYDAVNAIGPKRYRPYLLNERFSARASKDAAVATAAHAVLRSIVSTVPNVTETARASLLQSLDTQYANFLATIPDGRSEDKGIEAGNAAAAAMIAARQGDGRFGPSQWVPNTAPGHWWPLTDPATGQQLLDPTPWVGGVKPFLMKTSSQFRTPGPNPLSSEKWAREFNEVKRIGAANSTLRTDDQTYIARWWQSNPVASWNDVARQLAAREGLDANRTARLFAMQDLSGADASINCWNDKYYWDFWRPWNAIPRAGEDGNPGTEAQAGWTSLIAAPYPEHPSGHLCLDGANTAVLRAFFGDAIEGGYQITSASLLLQPTDERMRTFGSFSQALTELVEARIWAGLHFRTADLQGKALGQTVACYAARHYFQPVGHGHGSRAVSAAGRR
jgi:hypothetical protein